jgi:hypothetical protein
MTTQEKIANSETGIRENNGKLRWGLVDYKALEPMIRVLEFGARKYSDDNWKKGLVHREVLESAQRHLAAMLSGENIDNESYQLHAGHVMCNLMFWVHFYQDEERNLPF